VATNETFVFPVVGVGSTETITVDVFMKFRLLVTRVDASLALTFNVPPTAAEL
jgi:hypothetical protein